MNLEIGFLALTFCFTGLSLLLGLKRIATHGVYFVGTSIASLILVVGLFFRVLAARYFSPIPFSLFVVPQYMAWVIFLFGPLYLFGIAWIERVERPRNAIMSALGGLVLVLVAGYSFLLEPYNLEVSHYEITSLKISEPVRIGLISDIQTDNPSDYELRVLKTLASEQPDVIIMSGDYVQVYGTSGEYRDSMNALLAMFSEAGLENVPIYAVQGDSERPSEWASVMRDFTELNIHAIERTTQLDGADLKMTALSFRDSRDRPRKVVGSDKFHIVFGHRPDYALMEFDADLLLAGHVHGGQVQFPLIGPLVTATHVPKSWVNGDLIELDGNKHLVISRGIGMERGDAPRLRFLCRPQLVMIDLLPAN